LPAALGIASTDNPGHTRYVSIEHTTEPNIDEWEERNQKLIARLNRKGHRVSDFKSYRRTKGVDPFQSYIQWFNEQNGQADSEA